MAFAAVFEVPAARAADERVPGQVVVGFSGSVSAQERGVIRRGLGARLVSTLGDRRQQLLTLPRGADVDAIVRRLKRRGDVAYAEPNFVVRAAALPDDPRLGEQWGLRNTGQMVGGVAGTAGEDVNAVAAWALTQGSADMLVAVVDTGIDYEHPDLAANVWRNPGESGSGREHNRVDDDANGLIDDVFPQDLVDDDFDPVDENGHGTRVAGVLAARGNDRFGMTGLAWRAKLLPIRVLDRQGVGDTASVATAFRDAAQRGARIVNASLGGPQSNAVADAIGDADETLFVVAAGNSGRSVDDGWPTWPCAYTFENLLCVGAADATGRLASFSSYGDASVDLVAPGVSVLAPQPDRRTIYTDDFETPLGGRWTTGGTGNQFGRSTRWALSPTHSLADSPDGDHGLHVRSWAETVQPLDLRGLGDCRLDYTINNQRAGDSYFDFVLVNPTIGHETLGPLYLWEQNGRQSVSFGVMDGLPDVRLHVDFATNDEAGDGLYLDDLKVHCVDPALPARGHGLATGTSFAAPLVAATAVLRRSLHPDESIAVTKAAILDGARIQPRLGGLIAGNRYLDARGALDARPKLPVGPATGVISTIAGNGEGGWMGDGGRGTLAALENPRWLERLADGSLVFQDGPRGRLRRLGTDGIITTLADPSCDGFCPPFPRGDFPVGLYTLEIGLPSALPDGGFLFTEPSRDRIRRFAPDGSLSTVATIDEPTGVKVEPDGGFTVFSRDHSGNLILVRRAPDGTLTTLAGGGTQYFWSEGMDARELWLPSMGGYAIAPDGSPLFSATSRIWRLGRDGAVHALAGTGNPGYSGDGGPATKARMQPSCLLVRPEGGILFCDGSGRVRLIDTAGRVWTVAGGPRLDFGFGGYGDGGPATGARLADPISLAGLPDGGFVISDYTVNRLRQVQSLTLPPAPDPTATPTPTNAPDPTPPAAVSYPANPAATPAPLLAPPRPRARPRRRRAWALIRSRSADGSALIRRVTIQVPAHARFSATCRGPGCPFGRRAYAPRKRARVIEIVALRRARLRPGTRLTFVLRARRSEPDVARYRVTRAGTVRRL